MDKVDQAKIMEQVADAMPYLYRMMKDGRSKLHGAGSPDELEREVIALMCLAFSMGIGFHLTEEKTN